MMDVAAIEVTGPNYRTVTGVVLPSSSSFNNWNALSKEDFANACVVMVMGRGINLQG